MAVQYSTDRARAAGAAARASARDCGRLDHECISQGVVARGRAQRGNNGKTGVSYRYSTGGGTDAVRFERGAARCVRRWQPTSGPLRMSGVVGTVYGADACVLLAVAATAEGGERGVSRG